MKQASKVLECNYKGVTLYLEDIETIYKQAEKIFEKDIFIKAITINVNGFELDKIEEFKEDKFHKIKTFSMSGGGVIFRLFVDSKGYVSLKAGDDYKEVKDLYFDTKELLEKRNSKLRTLIPGIIYFLSYLFFFFLGLTISTLADTLNGIILSNLNSFLILFFISYFPSLIIYNTKLPEKLVCKARIYNVTQKNRPEFLDRNKNIIITVMGAITLVIVIATVCFKVIQSVRDWI